MSSEMHESHIGITRGIYLSYMYNIPVIHVQYTCHTCTIMSEIVIILHPSSSINFSIPLSQIIGQNHVIDAIKYLTTSNHNRSYIKNHIRLYIMY